MASLVLLVLQVHPASLVPLASLEVLELRVTRVYRALRVLKVSRALEVKLESLGLQEKQDRKVHREKMASLERRVHLVLREILDPQVSQGPGVPQVFLVALACLVTRVRGVWVESEASRVNWE